jgi:hypothetical protein
MIYKTHSKEVVLEKLSNLQPLNYNQFRWWRRWDSKNKPLHKLKPLLDKIRNGDFDYSHYYWQAQFCEIEMNEKYLQLKDPGRWMEETQLDRARRKRLYEDFEKDEAEKLKQIKKQFVLYFKMNKDDYEKEVIEFGGSLEDFYFYCKQKFGMYEVTIIPKRGRKPKNETN